MQPKEGSASAEWVQNEGAKRSDAHNEAQTGAETNFTLGALRSIENREEIGHNRA